MVNKIYTHAHLIRTEALEKLYLPDFVMEVMVPEKINLSAQNPEFIQFLINTHDSEALENLIWENQKHGRPQPDLLMKYFMGKYIYPKTGRPMDNLPALIIYYEVERIRKPDKLTDKLPLKYAYIRLSLKHNMPERTLEGLYRKGCRLLER